MAAAPLRCHGAPTRAVPGARGDNFRASYGARSRLMVSASVDPRGLLRSPRAAARCVSGGGLRSRRGEVDETTDLAATVLPSLAGMFVATLALHIALVRWVLCRQGL